MLKITGPYTLTGARLVWISENGKRRETWLDGLDFPLSLMRAVCRCYPLHWVIA